MVYIKSKELRITILMLLAMITWGLSWTNAKIVGNYGSAPLMMFWRFFIATLSFAPIVWWHGQSLKITKEAIRIIILNSIFMVSYNYFFFKGTQVGFAGAGVQWLRDKVKLISNASDTEKIVKSLKSNSGIYLVPAFTGLGAPYWKPNARGIICGLTRDTSQKEIVRATLESVAYQSYDLFNAMKNDGLKPNLVKVDGGMIKNNWFSQFLSNIIDTKIIRPKVQETTALGAAFMAGLKIGVYKSLSDISKNWKIDQKFTPKISKSDRTKLLKGWDQAIRKTLI